MVTLALWSIKINVMFGFATSALTNNKVWTHSKSSILRQAIFMVFPCLFLLFFFRLGIQYSWRCGPALCCK